MDWGWGLPLDLGLAGECQLCLDDMGWEWRLGIPQRKARMMFLRRREMNVRQTKTPDVLHR